VEGSQVKARKRKRIIQKQIRYNNSWNWSFDKFVRAVVTASSRMSAKMAEVYAKARSTREAEQ
jgi:hypothetical protein